MFIRALFAAAIFAIGSQPAFSQDSLSDIKEKLAGKTSELEEVDQLLAHADKNHRIAAMELLLRSGNPIFVKRAKETGLFSSDPEMQQAALNAVFDSGGPFRLVLDLSGKDDEEHLVKAWSNQLIWNPETSLAEFVFRTAPFDAKAQCWKFPENNTCAIYLSGTTASIRDWYNASGSFQLGGDGRLSGTFRNTGSPKSVPVPAYIPLAE
ncbi:hypothetical protein [Mesorhizobium sp. L-2-11]|uniref:hypothetical protein n=1 Tax=Mesorhizobium sp. L-2-11 TaxID=2744521 RepID=UPI0019284339|nr:hypothetical protein [Mesorhizobium sp. L-2-11]BCH15557.1 hypothetical protein MesoLjLa_24080 [Mesorhizobium sp. L-2-11]